MTNHDLKAFESGMLARLVDVTLRTQRELGRRDALLKSIADLRSAHKGSGGPGC